MPGAWLPLEDHYDQSYYLDRESWLDFRIEAERIVGLARLTRDSVVLEIGCGAGELLDRMRRRVRLAVGVDVSPVGLRLAMERRSVIAVAGRAEKLPLRDSRVDVVVAQHLIEHLPYAPAAMEEWHRVLRPGGRLVIATPNAAYPDRSHFEDPTHTRIFTPESLAAGLEEAGFRVERLFTLFPYLGKGRLGRAASIRLATLMMLIPPLAGKGRTILASATRNG